MLAFPSRPFLLGGSKIENPVVASFDGGGRVDGDGVGREGGRRGGAFSRPAFTYWRGFG